MKELKLIKLELENFKGIESLSFEPNGSDAHVFGNNATGKTTIYDAFIWLLFDKDSRGSKDFDIKTRAADGETIPMVDHTVTGTFNLDGKSITLKKVYAEKYTKKRGSSHQEFTGHTTDHFINDVPVKLKEYKEAVAEIADEDLFRLLTSPTYFNEQLHWQKQREILLAVCGDISDDDVITGNREFSELATILNGRKAGDHKKVLAGRRQEINRRLEEIPVRVDQIRKSIPDGPRHDPLAPIKKITELQKQTSDKRAEISRIENGGQVAELKKQLAEAETELAKMRTNHQQGIDSLVSKKREEVKTLKSGAEDFENIIKRAETFIADSQETAVYLTTENNKLREQWVDINSEKFEPDVDNSCPTCGQMLPQEQVAAAIEKASAAFNKSKADRLTKNVEQGRANKEKIDSLNVIIKTKTKDRDDSVAALQTLTEKVAVIEEEINRIVSDVPDLSDLEEFKDIRGKIMAVEAKIEGVQENCTAAVADLKSEIETIDQQVGEQQKVVASIEQRQKLEDDADQLKAEEKMIAGEFEELERQLFLIESFTRAKVSMLDEMINSKFELVKFRLFVDQINGGLQETCECTVNGVPYGSINNAARIQGGLDIIKTLSEYHNFKPVVFIDNRESIVDLPAMDQQVISLIVSGDDKQLRIEN